MNSQQKQLIKHLNKSGVDTRYISLYEDKIYVNNLKFSRFSRKKEDTLHETYPDIEVIRSTLFQKICIKVSRTIKNQIRPQQTIYIEDNGTAKSILLYVLLEPYKRKYGIKITNQKPYDLIANTKTLDDFTKHSLHLMLSGKKITNDYEQNNIYPLMHVYDQWIYDWIETTDFTYQKEDTKTDENIINLQNFLESHIPNVNESIIQSVNYLEKHNNE